ncbi:unnamed protein product [Kuraishia capsulata CBS 1993]|uniref:Vacuolar protein 14 C-terminal Fig4-binding domain-containing protein n=1 Tax=Kuraishia capsulata CBS 1993 TaxID=1382522 RepID=W6MFZ7_9ASCO|nr:uncharacterized protein KUCA_T00000861001 [Kuraishia capsulata CBS 1993]CDK24894.1 unnamed protein product [Kuraishia capsulata CBS 1993]
MSVKNGADILDRLIKDIVSEKAATYVSVLHKHQEINTSNTFVDQRGKTVHLHEPQTPTAFSIEKFIPVLAERIYVINPYPRMFLVSWLRLLDDIPELELISYLPTFLGGLIIYLSDTHEDVKVVTNSLLGLFLQDIKRIMDIKKYVSEEKGTNDAVAASSSQSLSQNAEDVNESDGQLYLQGQDVEIDFPKIIEILISNLDSTEETIQLVVLQWIETILDLASSSFIPFVPKFLSLLLKAIASDSTQLRESANAVNAHLMKLVSTMLSDNDSSHAELNYGLLFNQLTLHFMNDKEATRLAALDWLTMLHDKSPKKLLEHSDNAFMTLLKALNDPSDAVIDKDLKLLTKISNDSDDRYFNSFMTDLLSLFKSDRKLLETRGDFILSTICATLNAERIYRSLALVLESQVDLDFVSIMVQILNNNLITAPELLKLRKVLTSHLKEADEWSLFEVLFKSWCHNPPAALSLCLLSQNYDIAFAIVESLVEYEITVSLLVQLDLLVQLLESPIFAKLRMQLLTPEKNPDLYKCLYGILMILPQSSAFTTLRNRLSMLTHTGALYSMPTAQKVGKEKIERTIQLMKHFINVQDKYEEYRSQKRIQTNVGKINRGLKDLRIFTPKPHFSEDQILGASSPKNSR